MKVLATHTIIRTNHEWITFLSCFWTNICYTGNSQWLLLYKETNITFFRKWGLVNRESFIQKIWISWWRKYLFVRSKTEKSGQCDVYCASWYNQYGTVRETQNDSFYNETIYEVDKLNKLSNQYIKHTGTTARSFFLI